MQSQHDSENGLNIKFELNQQSLTTYLLNIYKHLYKQFVKQTNMNKKLDQQVNVDQLTKYISSLSQACNCSHTQFDIQACIKEDVIKKFENDQQSEIPIENEVRRFEKKLKHFSNIFEQIEEKFNNIDKKIQLIETLDQQKVPFDQYIFDQERLKSELNANIDQQNFINQQKIEQKLQNVIDKLSNLQTNFSQQSMYASQKLADLSEQMRNKITQEFIENYSIQLSFNFNESVRKQSQQVIQQTSEVIKTLEINEENRIQPLKNQIQYLTNEFSKQREILSNKCWMIDQQYLVKTEMDEKFTNIFSSIQKIDIQLESIAMMEFIEKQQKQINKEQSELKQYMNMIQRDVKEHQQKLRIISKQLQILDLNPQRILDIEKNIELTKAEQSIKWNTLISQIEGISSKQNSNEQMLFTQFSILNDQITKTALKKNDVIQIMEKELQSASVFKNRLQTLINNQIVLSDGTPFSLVISNLSQQNLMINDRIRAHERQIQLLQNNNKPSDENEYQPQLNNIYEKLNKMVTDLKQMQEQVYQLKDLELMAEKLNEQEKNQTVSILAGNTKQIKKKCTMCGIGSSIYRSNNKTTTLEKDKSIVEMPLHCLEEMCATQVIPRMKTCTYERRAYSTNKACLQNSRLRTTSKQD